MERETWIFPMSVSPFLYLPSLNVPSERASRLDTTALPRHHARIPSLHNRGDLP